MPKRGGDGTILPRRNTDSLSDIAHPPEEISASLAN
jgi:hypothetical protein